MRPCRARLGVAVGLRTIAGKGRVSVPRPPAVGTKGTLGGPTGEICYFFNYGSGRFFLTHLNKARLRAKMKSRSRFLEVGVGGINLHSVSFCRAILIHGVVLRKAGCLAFSMIIGCSRRCMIQSPSWRGREEFAHLDCPPFMRRCRTIRSLDSR